MTSSAIGGAEAGNCVQLMVTITKVESTRKQTMAQEIKLQRHGGDMMMMMMIKIKKNRKRFMMIFKES